MSLLLEVLADMWCFSRVRDKGNSVVCAADELSTVVEAEGITEGIVCVAADVDGSTDVSRYVTSVDCQE